MNFFFWKSKTAVDEGKIDEILTRGVSEIIEQNSLRKKMSSGNSLRVKLGIDPTSPDLHLGHSINLLKLHDFQKLGHTAVIIIGDATGVVGDTSDTPDERPMLSRQRVLENEKSYFDQIGKLLDLGRVEKKHNSKWLDRLTFSEIGEQADQFSVAGFIARENIKRRLDKGTRVSLREMLYPLMQGYDSVAVKADVELGGTDQRFNLLAGRTLQEYYKQKPQDVLITELLEGPDGKKMSKSAGNTINLNDSPKDMYGKTMKINDNLVEKYFVLCTRVPMKEVSEIMSGASSGQGTRDVKMRLAREIVVLYHGEEEAKKAEKNFVRAFRKKEAPEEMEKIVAAAGQSLADTLVSGEVVSSKADFKRLVDKGSIRDLDTKKKIIDPETKIEKNMRLRVGKKRFIEITLS